MIRRQQLTLVPKDSSQARPLEILRRAWIQILQNLFDSSVLALVDEAVQHEPITP